MISFTSLAISLYLAYNTRKKGKEEAAKEFVDLLGNFLETRQAIADLESASRKQQPPEPMPGLRYLRDKTVMLISRLLYLLRRFWLKVSPVELIIVAAGLIDSGRTGEAIPLYKRSMDVAPNDYKKAMSQRVYGRALIVSRKFEGGRQHMLGAVSLFANLENSLEFDSDQIRAEAVETYRRLISVSLDVRDVQQAAGDPAGTELTAQHVGDDLKEMESIVGRISKAEDRKRLLGDCAALRGRWLIT